MAGDEEIDHDPTTWSKTYPIAVTGTRQSPIDIRTESCCSAQGNELLSIEYPKSMTDLSLKNTGYGWTVQVPQDLSKKAFIEAGPLQGKYFLEQFHAHWGKDCSCGSEHTVDGKSTSAELHLVHWNSHKFSSFSEAVSHDKGLAVLAVFLEVGPKHHSEFDKITKLIKDIQYKGESVVIKEPIDLHNFLPLYKSYWTYEGSLTTPPLYESVTWIVMKNSIMISEKQLETFRNICRHKRDVQVAGEGKIVQNFRPPQPLHERSVAFDQNAMPTTSPTNLLTKLKGVETDSGVC